MILHQFKDGSQGYEYQTDDLVRINPNVTSMVGTPVGGIVGNVMRVKRGAWTVALIQIRPVDGVSYIGWPTVFAWDLEPVNPNDHSEVINEEL